MPKYEVTLYYSTFTTKEVEAESWDDAIVIARNEVDIDVDNLTEDAAELLSNLEPWEDCDDVEEAEECKI